MIYIAGRLYDDSYSTGFGPMSAHRTVEDAMDWLRENRKHGIDRDIEVFAMEDLHDQFPGCYAVMIVTVEE